MSQVGTGDGHLYVFENGATVLTRCVKAHTGAVYTLHPVFSPEAVTGFGLQRGHASSSGSGNPNGSLGGDGDDDERSGDAIGFWSGGKDGLVKFYDPRVCPCWRVEARVPSVGTQFEGRFCAAVTSR